MDAVKSFNNELSSLYEVKPPISKAKMTSLTRGAIKAIKFYKHVVQSVEKFILKCKPEYKVPGLYVIDSIVRQSRHQFGPERDVFASRFSKNMQQTFINLFKCPAEDKSKVIRVLNLWQKNQVFPPEVIQPLFDLTDPNHPMYKEQMLGAQSNGLSMQNSSGNNKGSPALQRTPKGASQVAHQTDAHLSGVTNNPGSITDQNTLAQLQQLQKLLQKQGVDGGKGEGQPVRFDRKLLDFDYDDEEDDDHVNPSPKLPSNNNNSAIETVGSLLSNPEVLRQLQTLQQTMTQAQAQQHQEMDIDTLRKLQEMKQQEEEFDKHLAQTVPKLPFASECDFKAPIINNSPAVLSNYYNMTSVQDMTIPPPGYKQPYDMPSQQDEATVDSEIQFVGGNDSLDLEVINLDHVDSISQSPQDERYSNRRRRSRSGDRSRDRVRERDRRSRRSRTRSRSRERRRRSRSRGRDREREREKQREREKEKERLKRGLPPVKKDNLSVCSTTLWVGHLSKLVHQEELSDTFGEFGDVVSIDLIPPRGCAFICMHRRQDALRCLEKLKSHKMQGKAITLAWAPGKGVKGKDLKDYWEVDLGVSYIPWTKLKPDIDMELLEEGGMIDEETMPSWLKTKQQQLIAPQLIPPPQPPMIPPEIVQVVSSITAPTMTTSIDTSQPPPMPSGLLQPPPLTLPLVSSFQLSNRLLGAVGMNLPHGMMSNVPIGVPPPSMSGAMLSNQLLGMGSPFGHQGPPGLLPPPLPMQTPDKIPTTITDNIGSRPESLLGLPFGMISQPQISMSLSHEDNMDVEMEDASDRMDKQPPLSDQLLAALGQQNNETSLSAAVSRLHAVTNQRSNSIMDSSSDGGDRRGDRVDRSRDKDRDHRSMRRNSRERNKDRDRDRDSRDRRDDRRDRTNRWGDRDRDDHGGERKERNEKSLNDRLREMAHQGSYKDRRSVDNDFNSRDSLPPPFHPTYNDRDDSQDLRINHEDRFRHGPPHDDSRVRRRSDNWEEPEFEPPPPFINRNDNGPPRPHMNRDDRPPMRHHFNRSEGGPHRPPLLDHEDIFMEDNRYRRNEDFMDEPIHDSYEPPMREGLPMRDGPGFGGPGMAGPGPSMGFRPGMGPRPPIMGPRPMMGPGPRMGISGPRLGPRPDFWGPPRPMRLHGPPDGFHPRGRMPNPHKFLPRGGPPMRGLRPPGPPMRHNFQPRFDGPPDHFQGHSGPPGPPGIFDDIPPPRERRDNRRQFSQQDYNGEEEHNGRDRRSTRWGNSAPIDNENEVIESEQNEITDNAPGDDIVANEDSGIVSQEPENVDMEQGGDGNSTPLHDEPRDHVVEKDEPQQVTETEGTTDSAEVIAE